MVSTIYVAAVENPYPDALGPIVNRITNELGARSELVAVPVDVRSVFDPARRQYNSTGLLEQLLGAPQLGEGKVIGVTGLDLFIPILTFVFGEAQLGGRAAVASSFRLRNSFYGLEPDHELTIDRLVKECLHELGHTLGLIHCRDFRCVMCASPSVEEIDLKLDVFCAACHRAIDGGRAAARR
jgi:archaemetzincin